MKRRIVAATAIALGLAFGLSGCNLFAPQLIQNYDASDGVNGTVGDIAVRNALIVSKDGEAGNLVVTLVNSGSRDRRLLVQYGDAKTDDHTRVAAGASKKLGPVQSPRIILENMDTQPGGLYPVYFQYGDQPGVQLLVPVLSGQLEEYSSLAPPTD